MSGDENLSANSGYEEEEEESHYNATVIASMSATVGSP